MVVLLWETPAAGPHDAVRETATVWPPRQPSGWVGA